MGNVAAGRREMPSKVFNSATVYLKNDEEAGGGKKCHPCLNFVVCGKYS